MQYQLTLRLIADASHNIGAEPIFVTEARLATASSPEADRRKIGINYSYARLSHEGVVRAFEACDTALKAAAVSENARVLDLSGMLSGRTDLFVDLVHTNEAGSRVFAGAIAAYLEPVLRGRVHSSN